MEGNCRMPKIGTKEFNDLAEKMFSGKSNCMEGKEIIENMTKGRFYVSMWGGKENAHVSFENDETNRCSYVAKLHLNKFIFKPKEERANAALICEAFNIANQMSLTPSQLQAELEKQKQEFTEVSIQNIESIFKLQSELEKTNKEKAEATSLLLNSVSKQQYIEVLNELEKAKELIERLKNDFAKSSWTEETYKAIDSFLEGSGNKTK